MSGRLGRWVADALDPVSFAGNFGMVPDAWQGQALRSESLRLAINVHRQGGKSSVAAVLALHQAIYVKRSVVLLVAPKLDQAQELYKKVIAMYRQLGRPVDAEQENALSLTLQNGSRIICLPGTEDTSRGYSASLVVTDEAARLPNDVFTSISPMVAITRGRIIGLSTPLGRQGWFFEATCSPRWEVITAKATDCPRLTAEFLEAERAEMGERRFAQEYLCEFISAEGAVFNSTDIEAIFEARPPKALPTAERKALPPASLGPVISPRYRIRHGAAAAAGPSRLRRGCQHRWRVETGVCVFCGGEKTEAL